MWVARGCVDRRIVVVVVVVVVVVAVVNIKAF